MIKKTKKTISVFLILLTIISLLAGCDLQGSTSNDKSQTEESKRIDLYVKVMESAFHEENGGDAFIAIKLDTLEGLSNEAKTEVLNELTDLSSNVYNFEEVKNDSTKFEVDDDGNLIKSVDGTLLWVEVEEYDESKSTITGVSWFGNLGAVFPTYEATFIDGEWQLELVSMAIS